MNNRRGLNRRDVLRAAGRLGLGGVSSGVFGVAVMAAEPLRIVNLKGSFTPILDEMINEGQYFQQVGLDATISIVADGTKVLAALISGSDDLCAGSGLSDVFPAIEKGATVKIVAGVLLRPQDALYSKRPDIRSTKDLVGKTVGTGPLGAQLHELALALLAKQGVDYRAVKFVNVGSIVDVFKAVAAGTVDAGFGSADVFDQQQKFGVHVLTDGALWNELPNFTNQVMIASDLAIAEKRDLLVKALAAHARVFRFLASPASEEPWVRARLASLHKDEPKVARSQWKFLNQPGMLATNLVLVPRQLEFIQQLNVKLGMQRKILPFEQVADMSIARDALKLPG